MRALANILPTALKDEKWGCWVLEKLYPALVKNERTSRQARKSGHEP